MKKAAAGRRHHPSVWLPVGIITWVLLLGYLPGQSCPGAPGHFCPLAPGQKWP